MSPDKHTAENQGTKLRAHDHTKPPYWKRAHRDWRVWVVVVLMVALVFVYVITDNLSIKPGQRVSDPIPAANVP